MLKAVAFASTLPLLYPSIWTYAPVQILFLVFCAKRINFTKTSLKRFILLTVTLLVTIYSPVFLNGFYDFDVVLKLANFILLMMFVKKSDVATFLSVLKPLAFINIILTICLFVLQLKLPIGRTYDYIYLLGREVNTGVIFELNYAAMFALVFTFGVRLLTSRMVAAALISTLYTFRFGWVVLIINLSPALRIFHRLNVIWVLGFFVFLILLLILFQFGPIFLEQRFFIWASFIGFYDIKNIYDAETLALEVFNGMAESNWGQMDNLHSGVLDTFGLRGVVNGVFLFILYVISLYRAHHSILPLLFFMICLSFMMSLSTGGLNSLSLFFSVLLVSIIVYGKEVRL